MARTLLRSFSVRFKLRPPDRSRLCLAASLRLMRLGAILDALRCAATPNTAAALRYMFAMQMLAGLLLDWLRCDLRDVKTLPQWAGGWRACRQCGAGGRRANERRQCMSSMLKTETPPPGTAYMANLGHDDRPLVC